MPKNTTLLFIAGGIVALFFVTMFFLSFFRMIGVLPNHAVHKSIGWKAENFFDDPKVVALCNAIEEQNLEEIDRLVAAGADVSARGKDGMTPLLWAYPAGEKSLERILEHGADPNTQYDSGFRSQGMIDAGDSLLFITIKSTSPHNTQYVEKFQNYIDILLKYGADPNLVQKNMKTVPLRIAIKFNNTKAAHKLVLHGANVDFKNELDTPLIITACKHKAFSIAQILLDHGADYRVIDKTNGLNVGHVLAGDYWLMNEKTEMSKQYKEVVAWLEARGMSIERAKEQREQKSNMLASSKDRQAEVKAIVKKFITEVSQPEIERWLPPDAAALPDEKIQNIDRAGVPKNDVPKKRVKEQVPFFWPLVDVQPISPDLKPPDSDPNSDEKSATNHVDSNEPDEKSTRKD